jgi:hypothetical protein
MRRRTKILAVVGLMLVGAFVVFMGVGGFADTKTGNVNVSAGIAPTIQLTMGADIAFGTVAPGNVYNQSTTMTVNSNKTWGMTVTKDGDLRNGSFSIPSANLTFTSTSTDGKVKGLVSSDTEFGTGTSVCSGSDRGSGEPVTVHYKLDLSSFGTWDLEAVSYSAQHTYTATND